MQKGQRVSEAVQNFWDVNKPRKDGLGGGKPEGEKAFLKKRMGLKFEDAPREYSITKEKKKKKGKEKNKMHSPPKQGREASSLKCDFFVKNMGSERKMKEFKHSLP